MNWIFIAAMRSGFHRHPSAIFVQSLSGHRHVQEGHMAPIASCMAIKLVEKMKISWKNSVSWGKWKSWLPWFQSIFRFFSKSKIDPIIWVLRFLKSKGGPFGEKNLKKIDFHVWYLKRTALKNVDWQWNRFLKILIFGEVMDQKVPKNRHFWQFWWFWPFFGTI